MRKKKNNTGLFFIIGFAVIIAFSVLISNLAPKDEEEEVVFNKVTYAQYKTLLVGEDLEFVYVGNAGCGYCKMVVPLLGQLQTQYAIVFNYLDTYTMSSDDFVDIQTTAEVFAGGKWGTPTLLAIKNAEVISTVSGYRELDALKEFVEDAIEYEAE